MTAAQLLVGDALTVLRTLPDGAARCCVTSPPYFGLRDYGVDGQIGLESTPDAYVARLVEVFREVRRVLADDGTLWLNLGDSYASRPNGSIGKEGRLDGDYTGHEEFRRAHALRKPTLPPGLKHKDLIGIPWRVAFALQADGWYLRQDIIWHKPNPMPESVRDRPTKAHEYLFLLSKARRYHYNAEAVAEDVAGPPGAPRNRWDTRDVEVPGQRPQKRTSRSGNMARKTGEDRGRPGSHLGGSIPWEGSTRNSRSVWTIATRPYAGAHFATMPSKLAERCILAGSAPGDTVLDPFGGSGTTAATAVGHGRRAIHIDLNAAYHDLATDRVGPNSVTSGAA